MSQTDTTIIAGHCLIKGEVQFDGPTVIGGRVEGSITANDALEIAAEGTVEGDIHGVLVDIQGELKGNVFASRACRLGATARVTGELRAANLAIAEGASFVGQVYVGASAAEEVPEEEPAHGEPAVAPVIASPVNRIEALTQEVEAVAATAATAGQPVAAAPSGPMVRIMPQAIQNAVNRSPKIIKAR